MGKHNHKKQKKKSDTNTSSSTQHSPLQCIEMHSIGGSDSFQQMSAGTGGYRDRHHAPPPPPPEQSENDFEIGGYDDDEADMISDITAITRAIDEASDGHHPRGGRRDPKRSKMNMFLPCFLFIICIVAVALVHGKGSNSNGSGFPSATTILSGNRDKESPSDSQTSNSSNSNTNNDKPKSDLDGGEEVVGKIIEFTVANLNTNAKKCTHNKHILQCIPSHNNATNKFRIQLHPQWAPIGVERFETLTKSNFWGHVRIFRIVPNFISQFGISSYPDVQDGWTSLGPIPDEEEDSVASSNYRGTVSFASSGKDTRTTQVFINTNDNWYLDGKYSVFFL